MLRTLLRSQPIRSQPTGRVRPGAGLALPPRRQRRGIALVVVMVTIMLVALAAYGFHYQMTEAYRVSRMQAERVQARLAAESGVEAMLALAERSRAQRQQQIERGGERLFRSELEGGGASEREEVDGWSFAVVSPASEPAIPSSGTSAGWRFGWRNESAKLNVPMLRRQEEIYPGHAEQTLAHLPGATPGVVAAFLKAQSFPAVGGRPGLQERWSEGGGEASPRRLTRLWTGDDWDHNYRLDPLEIALGKRPGDQAGAARDQQTAPRAWRQFLTFDSGQRNENQRGEPRIFLNGSDLSRLHQRLLAVFSSDEADFVILARQYGLVPADAVSPPEDATYDLLSETDRQLDFEVSAQAAIANPLDLAEAMVEIPDAEEASVWIRSPFRRAFAGDTNYLTTLVDDLTVDPNPVINGQIDINEAPPEVLWGIPEISAETVERIVQARQNPPSAGAPRASVAWLLREDVVELATLRRWLPWITVGGDCFRAQVIGFRDRLSPVFRCTVTFDGRQRPAIRRGFQQWHLWGRGFAPESLRENPSL